MKLKTLVKQEWLEENSKDEKAPLPNRDSFLSSISTYEGYGKSVYRENKLKETSASSTILQPIRSFTDPPGLKNSHLANNSQPRFWPILFSFTTGVCPIVSKMESWIILNAL